MTMSVDSNPRSEKRAWAVGFSGLAYVQVNDRHRFRGRSALTGCSWLACQAARRAFPVVVRTSAGARTLSLQSACSGSICAGR